MSELEKAKQEVEQVCFAYDKAGDTGDIKDWKDFYDLDNKLIDKVKIANQPQLTIPKSIAESNWMKHLILCSSITQFEFERYNFLDKEEERFLKWVNTGNNENILYIYLASKRIGVDLVKVVEG
ncbi:hypothetical protein E5555_05330 [Lactococcus lactis]|uniref:hypothetical protein n=1 Tax=Lactococcus lactis TaxID=1358 RepID=UPI00109C74ED|nr:hypothetical protein [Lactococcus lactis]THA54538.1 hypothetical protein E5555_05330 [Lactococcus lactis]